MKIQVRDKKFKVSITSATIQKAIDGLAQRINGDFQEKDPVFLCVLNGSFMFAADLMKRVNIPSEISFIKLASYQGSSSTGVVKTLIGLDKNLEGRDVLVLEDIVDTGTTLEFLIDQLKTFNPKSVKIVSLLFKPNAYHGSHPIDYIGMDVPNDFLVGYGLDYDGHGRNLEDIYVLDPVEETADI